MGDPAGCCSGCQWGQVAEERGNSATNTACPTHIKDTQLARFYKKENYIKEINVKKSALPLGLLKRNLVPRYRLSQIPLLLLKHLLVKDEGHPHRIPNLGLVCLYSFSSPLPSPMFWRNSMPTPFPPSCTFCANANDYFGQIGEIWDSRALGIRVRAEKSQTVS